MFCHFSCKWIRRVLDAGSHSVCMDSAQSHFSCPGCRVSFSVSVPVLYVWTLHSPTSPVPDAGCHSRYLSPFCMYGLCTVPLLLSWMPGVILGICPYSVCMDSAQSHFSCPGCRVSFSVSVPVLYVWTLHSPTSPVLDAGCHSRYLSIFCMYGLCTVPTSPVLDAGCHSRYLSRSVCMDSAQSHFSCPGCRVSFSVSVPILYVWTLHSPTSPVPDAGVSFSVSPHSVCMDSAQSHFSCP
ncbi:unnamed protein product, partial [Staurois parvus]